MAIRIPNLAQIEARAGAELKVWEEYKNYYQDIKLHEPLEIAELKDAKVLVFAGSTGEIAAKLAGPKEFIFTDLSKKRLQAAKKSCPPGFLEKAKFIACNAHFMPLKDNCADFAFSFEPIPVLETGYFILELMRCAKSGLIIAYSRSYDIYTAYLDKIAEAYGLRAGKEEREVNATISYGWRKEKPVGKLRVHKYFFTAEAKEWAAVDLEIIKKANQMFEQKGKLAKEDIKNVQYLLNMTTAEFNAALKRIAVISACSLAKAEIIVEDK